MVLYRRNFLPDGTFFFTVTLADRHSSTLVDHVAELRYAFRAARRERPFSVKAIVILPEHLHAVLTLPPADADFSGRWRRIKGHFSTALINAGTDISRAPNGDLMLWQRRFWEHTIRDDNDFERHIDYIHSIRSSTVSFSASATGHIPRSIAMSRGACSQRIGQETSATIQGDTANGQIR